MPIIFALRAGGIGAAMDIATGGERQKSGQQRHTDTGKIHKIQPFQWLLQGRLIAAAYYGNRFLRAGDCG
jgi:hypothetical protein